MCHPVPLTKQIILIRMDCESKNKGNCELFWGVWTDALAGCQAGLMYEPVVVLLDRR